MIVDTHCHIFDDKFDGIREDVINESLEMGVEKLIVVGYDEKTSKEAVRLAQKYDFCYAAVGLHPSEVLKNSDRSLRWLYNLLENNKKIVAVGEIGLDYYWDKSFKEEQKEMFIKQINIANEFNLPIIIHCRDAVSDCYDILKENKSRGVMHCYSSSLEMAREFVKIGFYLGIGGVVTFKNSVEIKKVVEGIELKWLLSETDCPYLAPVPFRGKTNHPGYTKYVVEKIAEIKNISIDEVEEALYNNAVTLFKLEE